MSMSREFPSRDLSTYRQQTGFGRGSPTFYVSSVSPKKPPVFDARLLDQDNDLSIREEDFLIELRDFYEGCDRYEELRAQVERNCHRLAGCPRNLEQLAANIAEYRDALERRAKNAQKSAAEPIEDLTADKQRVEQLENEVRELRRRLPRVPSREDMMRSGSIKDKLREANSVESANAAKEKELARRKGALEERQKKLEDELAEFERAEQEEDENMRKAKANAKEILDNTPDVDVEKIEKARRRKEKLLKKKEDLAKKKEILAKKAQDSEQSAKKQEEDLADLQKQLEELKKLKERVEEANARLKELEEEKKQLDIDASSLDDEIAKIKRKLEVQGNELRRLENLQKDLDERKQKTEGDIKELEDKKKDLERRREQLKKDEAECEEERQKLEKLKEQVAAKDDEVSKLEKEVKEMLAKVTKAQEEIDAKGLENQDGASSERFNELQKLLFAASSEDHPDKS